MIASKDEFLLLVQKWINSSVATKAHVYLWRQNIQ